MSLPQDILESAGRVWDYHQASKLTESSPPPPPAPRPVARVFDYLPKAALSPKLLDLPTPTLTILTRGVDALPESLQSPPQDLRTLSTWLYMAAGLHAKPGQRPDVTRPGEIYVAAFAIDGLEPGFYHFGPSEFALRQLRDGPETLALLRRGRPDLNFLATAPAALLVSSVFSRASAVNGRRGYRMAALDAGMLVADCVAAATGLGVRTLTRLRMTESSMRELLGLSEDVDYANAEAVQAMVAWADVAARPMVVPPPAAAGPPLQTIPRPPAAGGHAQPGILAVHRDVTARGVAVREVRPPLTELSPISLSVSAAPLPQACPDLPSRPIREALTEARPAEAFQHKPLSRDVLCHLSMTAFRTGTFFPLKPDGPHAGLVRPLWVMQEASGHEEGVWYHDPIQNNWSQLTEGQFREQTGPLTAGRDGIEQASAVCVVVANLRKLLLDVGPDAYRLAHVEAGVAVRKMHLAAHSLGLACRAFGTFYDEPWRKFLGLDTTWWEVLAVVAVGGVVPPKPSVARPAKRAEPERAVGVIGFRD